VRPVGRASPIRRYVRAGFDHIILTQIGPDQDYFFDFVKRELAPELRKESPELAPARGSDLPAIILTPEKLLG
jgi:hypothetical protein